MKPTNKTKKLWKEVLASIARFPFAILLLLAAAITNAIDINDDIFSNTYRNLLYAFLLGAFTFITLQLLYERYYKKAIVRILFGFISIAVSSVYYLLIMGKRFGEELSTRTIVLFFILLVAFLWIPAIKSRITFNDSFMATFKAFFMALLFNGILFIGVALILGAANMLLFDIHEDAFLHSSNIIFLLIAPIHFLSMIPYYSNKMHPAKREGSVEKEAGVGKEESGEKDANAGKEESVEKVVSAGIEAGVGTQADAGIGKGAGVYEGTRLQEEVRAEDEEIARREEALVRAITPAKFLEALISYVIIPITAVFTIILLLYIIMNITGDFWTDNLMEPMLVTYSITVIIVYLLASTINNVFTKYFRMIFPKVLVPIVLFQTLSSVLKIGSVGITYGRYYVILFGVFATIAGIIFCIKPVRENGFIAPILLVLSLISILPFVNAFSVSFTNQTGRLEAALERNDMLRDDAILPNSKVSEEDRQIIKTSVWYLSRMDYVKKIDWLSDYTSDTVTFEKTFGFTDLDHDKPIGRYIQVTREQTKMLSVEGYDLIIRISNYKLANMDEVLAFDQKGKSYTLWQETNENDQILVLKEGETEILRFEMNEIYNSFADYSDGSVITTEEATFTKENDEVVLSVVADTISLNQWEDEKYNEAEYYILIKIK